ncbi:MAG: DUF1573 domain-containing protein [Planctomycetaceae bacterium]|jgi:hypothetical protein|nr:DUF1573 domain-containing protein [Planctomycetaceae bacterium]
MRTIIVILISIVIGVVAGVVTANVIFAITPWSADVEFQLVTDTKQPKPTPDETTTPDSLDSPNSPNSPDKPQTTPPTNTDTESTNNTAATNSKPNAGPKAYIESTVYDFGIKDVKDSGTREFAIKNIGTGVLTLKVEKKTCTCTGIDLSRQRISAGETAIATVRYNAERATTGRYEQGGIIATNDPNTPEIMLTIRGMFTAPIMMNSPVVFLPSVSALEKQTAKVRIYGFEKIPLELSSPQWSDKTHFDCTFERSELSDEDKQNSLYKYAESVCEATISVLPGLSIGSFQEQFNIKTNFKSEPSIDIFVRGQVFGNGITMAGQGFDRTTGIMSIETIKSGQKLLRDMSIQLTGTEVKNAEVKVKEVRPEWLNVTITKGAVDTDIRRFFTLSIEIPPNAPQCNFINSDNNKAAMVELETGLPNAPIIKIPIRFAIEK